MVEIDSKLEYSTFKEYSMIVCFSGWKGNGKDTCANYLIQNNNAVRVALADPLKDSVAEEFGIDRQSLDDPKRKEAPILDMPVDPKDTYSRMIAEFLFKEFRDKKGRQPIKYITGDYFEGVFDDASCGQLYFTPRALAIIKGSTNRSVRSDFWVNKAFDAIQKQLNDDKLVVVTDLRYQSEMVQFKEKFGNEVIFVRVNRFETSPSQDPSERDLDNAKFDYYVDNSGSIENTNKQVKGFLKAVYFAK